MIMHEKKSDSGFPEFLARLKTEISSIIAEGQDSGRESESIVDEILRRTVLDKDIVIMEGTRAERPLNIEEVLFVARKAVEQAEFDGASVILPSGEKIKRKESFNPRF